MRARLLFGLLMLMVLAPDLSRWSTYLEPLWQGTAEPKLQPSAPPEQQVQSIGAKAVTASARVAATTPPVVSAAIGSAPEVPITMDRDVRVIVARALNLREGPSVRTDVLGRLVNGTKVVVVEQQRGWLRVESEDGQTGWVFARYVAGT